MFGFLQVTAEVTTAIGLFHSTWKLSDYISHKNYLPSGNSVFKEFEQKHDRIKSHIAGV
jgi:hypothetical protein